MGQVAYTRDVRNTYDIFDGNLKRKKPSERPRRETEIREVVCENKD
jgi:hypothetical protein